MNMSWAVYTVIVCGGSIGDILTICDDFRPGEISHSGIRLIFN